MRLQVSMPKSFVFIFTIVLLTSSVLGNLSYGDSGPQIYWADSREGKILRADPEGTKIEDIITGLNEPKSIALDLAGGKIYWTDDGTGKIQRANLDGTEQEDLVTGLELIGNIALDVAGGRIYWTASNNIQSANLNGTNMKRFHFGLVFPTRVALDVAAGKMYWTDFILGNIQRANLDGTRMEDILTGLDDPREIALDTANGKIYWTTWFTNKIQAANMDGTNMKDIGPGSNGMGGIALDAANGKIYWTDWWVDKIRRANLDGTNEEDLPIAGLSSPQGIALDPAPQPSEVVVSIADPHLAAAIRNQIGESITSRTILNLTELNVENKGIKDLTGLEHAYNLRKLLLPRNSISDVAPLSELTRLHEINLSDNAISDVAPLVKLTQLRILVLANNKISDVRPLAELVNLEELHLYGNSVKDRKALFALLHRNPDVRIYLKNDKEPLPVTLSYFQAQHTDTGVVLNWTTESEMNNAGFHIYRSRAKDGEFKAVNPTMIQGAGTTSERNKYTWTDKTAKPNTVYYYRIVDVSYTGEQKQLATIRIRGLVSASGKWATRWGDLKTQH